MYQLFLRTEKQWYLLLWYWHSLNPKMSIRWQNKIWQTNPSSQSYVFSSGHVPMWDLDHKEGWAPKNCCFPTVMLNKTLKSLLDCKIKAVSPKGNQHWTFIGKTEAEAEAPILWSPDTRSWPIGKDSDAREDWGQENGVTGWDGWIPVGMSLSKLEEIVKDREAWSAAGHAVTDSWTPLRDWETTNPSNEHTHRALKESNSKPNAVIHKRAMHYNNVEFIPAMLSWAFTFSNINQCSLPH